MNEINKKVIELIICLRGELGHDFNFLIKKTWRLRINTASISYPWGVGKQGWDIWWEKKPLLWDWSSPSWCIFQAFQVTTCTGISESREFPLHGWVIRGVGVSVLWCPAMAELDWAAPCHLTGFICVLWISEQWWFFSLGRCCSHHPKAWALSLMLEADVVLSHFAARSPR